MIEGIDLKKKNAQELKTTILSVVIVKRKVSLSVSFYFFVKHGVSYQLSVSMFRN